MLCLRRVRPATLGLRRVLTFTPGSSSRPTSPQWLRQPSPHAFYPRPCLPSRGSSAAPRERLPPLGFRGDVVGAPLGRGRWGLCAAGVGVKSSLTLQGDQSRWGPGQGTGLRGGWDPEFWLLGGHGPPKALLPQGRAFSSLLSRAAGCHCGHVPAGRGPRAA